MCSKLGIVTSKKDPASMNIRKVLLDLEDWYLSEYTFKDEPILESKKYYLITIRDDLIFSDYLKNLPIPITGLIFASRHESKSKIPCLLVHFPGNWTDSAPYGGRPRSLSIADPLRMKALFITLLNVHHEYNLKGITVGIEVTHHGPTDLNFPSVFIEIGSSLEMWKNPKLGEIISRTILEHEKNIPDNNTIALGFGGPHYAPNFVKIITQKKFALSHIAPKVRKKAVSKAFKMLKEIVGVSIKPPDPEKYIISFGKELGLSGKCIKLALFISQSAKERGLGIGKDPAGLAAAALYFASLELGEKRTQKRIAEVAAITEVTVRNRYRELRKKLNDIFSQPHFMNLE